MITRVITAWAASAIFLCACHNNTSKNDMATLQKSITARQPVFSDSMPVLQQSVPPATNTENKNQSPPTPKPTPVDWDKKIIKTADITTEVADFKAFSSQTKEMAKKYGGYIAGEKQQESAYKIENVLAVKVPVDMFDDMMNELARLPVKIISKQVSSQDVTTEIVDTKSRIEAKKEVREKYMEFLRGAKNMEEMLQVQQQINDIQEQIETATGRVTYLSHASAYSTINLTYYQVLDEKAVKEKGEEPGFGNQLGKAMFYGIDIIKMILLALVTIWPLLLMAAIVLLIYRRRKK
jgi:hypothetical protein